MTIARSAVVTWVVGLLVVIGAAVAIFVAFSFESSRTNPSTESAAPSTAMDVVVERAEESGGTTKKQIRYWQVCGDDSGGDECQRETDTSSTVGVDHSDGLPPEDADSGAPILAPEEGSYQYLNVPPEASDTGEPISPPEGSDAGSIGPPPEGDDADLPISPPE